MSLMNRQNEFRELNARCMDLMKNMNMRFLNKNSNLIKNEHHSKNVVKFLMYVKFQTQLKFVTKLKIVMK